MLTLIGGSKGLQPLVIAKGFRVSAAKGVANVVCCNFHRCGGQVPTLQKRKVCFGYQKHKNTAELLLCRTKKK
jgi:hypothetical protein